MPCTTESNPPPPPAARPSGRDPAALIGPLKRKLEAAEQTLARETRTAAELDALLAERELLEATWLEAAESLEP